MYLSYVLAATNFFIIFVFLSAILKLMSRQWQQSRWIIEQYKQRESLLYLRLMGKDGKLEQVPEADESISQGERYVSPFPDEVITDKVEQEIENETPKFRF